MAIRNLFGRGIGFGAPHWIVTRGYGVGSAVAGSLIPSPHRLQFETPGGVIMGPPFIFTATETGPVTLRLVGADGSVPDLASADSVTFSLQNQSQTLVVNAVSLSSLTDEGTGVWTRTTNQVATPGDYLGQVRVVDEDGAISLYPDAIGSGGYSGAVITMLRPVGG